MFNIKKILTFLFLGLLIFSCEQQLSVDLSTSDMAVIRVGITGASSRSIMPVYPELENMVYDLYGTSSSSREEVLLYYDFIDLNDTEFTLKPGTWNFTLKAFECVDGGYNHVLTGERKGVILSSGDNQIINFNLKPINDPNVNGYAYIYVELPNDNLIDYVEVYLDGELYDDAPIDFYGDFLEYSDEFPPGDYHISFIFKDENDVVISVISEILVIRSGAESWNEYFLTENDINGIPAVPLNFVATSYNSSTGLLSFKWDDNSFNEKGFILFDEYNDEEVDIPAGTNSYNLNIGSGKSNAELEGKSYYLCAWNDFGYSNDAEYKLVKPTVPTGLSTESISSSSIKISWQPVNGAYSYDVYRSASSTGTYTSIGSSSNHSYTDVSLSANTTYYYKIRASGILGTSEQSNYIAGQTKLIAPTGVQASAASTTSITVSWNPITAASGYRVYRSTSSAGTYTLVGSPAAASFTDTGLTASTPYYYKVAGNSAAGEGDLSSSVTATIVTYTVAYNANGAAGTISSQTVLAGSNISLPYGSSYYTLSGYSFLNWNTNSAGTGTSYSSGSSFTVNSNITLYAIWYKSSYVITFNANGGTGTVPEQKTVSMGNEVQLPGGASLSMSGYTFAGWNTNSTGTGTNYNEYSYFTPSADMTLYARWISTSSGEVLILDSNASGWQKIYNPSSLFNGQRVMQGDVYALNYSFVSNTYIDQLQVYLVDNSEVTGWGWNFLSDHVTIKYDIYSGYLISGTVYFIATATASNSTPEANRLVFQTGTGTVSQPTLSVTKLEIVKDTSGYIPLNLENYIENYLSSGSIHSYRIYLPAGWYYICWEDTDTDGYYFSADVKVGLRREGSSGYIVNVTDDGNMSGHKNMIDIYISNSDNYIIEVHGYSNSVSGTYGIYVY